MHDLLREMGREFACNSSPDEPGKHIADTKRFMLCVEAPQGNFNIRRHPKLFHLFI